MTSGPKPRAGNRTTPTRRLVQGQAVILNPRDHLFDKLNPPESGELRLVLTRSFRERGRRKKVEPLLRLTRSAVGAATALSDRESPATGVGLPCTRDR